MFVSFLRMLVLTFNLYCIIVSIRNICNSDDKNTRIGALFIFITMFLNSYFLLFKQ